MNIRNPLENAHFTLSNNMFWIILLVAMLGFITSGLVYSYHWRNYGTNERFMRHVQIVYVTVGIGLLALAAILIKFR